MSQVDSPRVWDLLIIGGGPAGLTCAIYAGRARLTCLLLEKQMTGGQAALNSLIENYPGFPEGIQGFELAQKMSEQAIRFGAHIETAEVQQIETSSRPFLVKTNTGQIITRAILIATGSHPRRLGVPGEKGLLNRGLSYCATCDGPLFADKRVVVVGGGNTAVDEALFLAGIASKVILVHRRDQLRADRILQERALANPKIEFLWHHTVSEIIGGESVQAIRAINVRDGAETEVPVDGVFIAIGTTPQTDFLPPEIKRSEAGFILTDETLSTNIKGIFAAGDVRVDSYRQVTVAVGEGALAYRSVFRYLEEL